MPKVIIIKLTKASPTSGPFDIFTNKKDVIATDVSRKDLIIVRNFTVDNNVTSIILESKGNC